MARWCAVMAALSLKMTMRYCSSWSDPLSSCSADREQVRARGCSRVRHLSTQTCDGCLTRLFI